MVNLFGHEGPPSLMEKNSRKEEELARMTQAQEHCEYELTTGKVDVREISNARVTDDCLVSVKTLSTRVKELREIKTKKNMSLDKWLTLDSAEEGKNPKYAYIVSALKTSILQIDACLQLAMTVIDKLLYAASLLQGDTT